MLEGTIVTKVLNAESPLSTHLNGLFKSIKYLLTIIMHGGWRFSATETCQCLSQLFHGKAQKQI